MKTSHIPGLVITVVALGPKLRPSYSECPLIPPFPPLISLGVYSKRTPWQTHTCHLSKTGRGSYCPLGLFDPYGQTKQPALYMECPQITAAPAISFQPYKVKLEGRF